MCECFDGADGLCTLYTCSIGDIDLNLKYRQIEIDDYYDKKTYCLLKINYCPVCGEKL